MLGICSRNNALASAKCPDFPSALTRFWAQLIVNSCEGPRVRLYNILRPAPRLAGVPVAACSQAHVFPAAWATRLADYLCRHTDVPKDIATHRLARADGLQTHFVQPLLFQHVGTYSVILHHEKNPANVV